jgi:hypothetical protein
VPTTASDEDMRFVHALEELKSRAIVALEVEGNYPDTAAELQKRFSKLLGSHGVERAVEISGKPARLNFYRAFEEMVEAIEGQAEQVAEAGI